MVPIEGPRRSKRTFAGSWEPTEPVDLNKLMRVREPVSRSKTSVQGKVADVLCGRSRHAESQNELRAFRIFAATTRADAWQEQPFFLLSREAQGGARNWAELCVRSEIAARSQPVGKGRNEGRTGGDGRRRLMSECCCITTAASIGGSSTPAGTI